MDGDPAVAAIWAAPALSRCGARIVATFDGRFFGHEPSPAADHVHECDRDAGHLGDDTEDPTDAWHLCRCLFRWP